MIVGESVPNMNNMPNMEFNEVLAKSSRTRLNQSFLKNTQIFSGYSTRTPSHFFVMRVTTMAKKHRRESELDPFNAYPSEN